MNEGPKTSNRKWLIAVIAALILVCCCCVVAVGFLWWDPLGLGLLDPLKMLIGAGGNPAPAAMPADTSMYMGVNLLNATPQKLDRVFKPFAEVLDLDTPDMDSALQDLDDQLDQELGITFTGDIQPWVGVNAGIGISNLTLNKYGKPENISLVLAIQSRDNKKADEFLAKLKQGMEDNQGAEFSKTTYQGATLYVLESDYEPGLAFGRSGSTVLLATGEKDLKAAIDAQKGDSLADNKAFQDMVKQLPNDRLATVFFEPQQFKDLYLSLLSENSSGIVPYGAVSPDQMSSFMKEQFDKVSGEAFSLSIVDVGLEIDMVVSYNLDKLSDQEKASLKQTGEAVKAVEMLPEGTLLYFAGQAANESWLTMRDQVIEMTGISQDEYDQAMSQLEDEIGLNPDTDLLPYLGGDVVVAVVPSTDGMLSSQLKVDLGALAVFGVTDAEAALNTADQFASALEDMGGPSIESHKAGDLTYYEAVDTYTEDTAFAFGVGKKYIVLGTSGPTLEELFAGGNTLVKSSSYQVATKALPGNMKPAFFADVAGLVGNIREGMEGYSLDSFNESVMFLEPIPTIIGGGSVQNNIVRSTLIVFITPVK